MCNEISAINVSIKNNKHARLGRTCPICGTTHYIVVDYIKYSDGVELYMNGNSSYDAFPNFTEYEREFILSGICDECFKTFKDLDNISI